MCPNRRWADEEGICDFPGSGARRKHTKDLLFAACQSGWGAGRRWKSGGPTESRGRRTGLPLRRVLLDLFQQMDHAEARGGGPRHDENRAVRSERVAGGMSHVHVEPLDGPVAPNHLQDVALAVAEFVAVDVFTCDQPVAWLADGVISTVAKELLRGAVPSDDAVILVRRVDRVRCSIEALQKVA